MKLLSCFAALILFAQPALPQLSRGDVLINEILFNPVKGGYDYVEGYNNSTVTIDLRQLKIASRNTTLDIASQRNITNEALELAPGAYFVVTPNEKWLRQHYAVPSAAIVCQVASMPSFADDAGTAIFTDSRDTIIDELSYSEKWHFPLISDPSGIALERINFSMPAQDPNNWTSASASSGYGTPGNKNSQYQDFSLPNDEIAVPRIFSPDNDGVNDIALIQYKMKEAGFVINAIVYDISGRKVRYLVRNEPIGTQAQYKWDGLDERSEPLPQGIYFVFTEMFNLNGKTKRSRHAIVLARR